MVFEVLPGLPPYGALPKLISRSGSPVYREGLVVRFLSGTDKEWVGNFQRGYFSLDHACMHPDGKHVLVIAGGSAYVIDPASQSVIRTFGSEFESCIPIPGNCGLLLSDELYVTLIDSQGLAWRTRRLAWDGLRILGASGGESYGEARHFDDSWHPFRVRLSDGQASGGAYDGPDACQSKLLRGSAESGR